MATDRRKHLVKSCWTEIRHEQRRGILAETLLNLRRRLNDLALRDSGRRVLIEGVASLFDVSRATVFRALSGQMRSKGLRRVGRGEPRVIYCFELERYCEIIADLKIHTSNKKGRRLWGRIGTLCDVLGS